MPSLRGIQCSLMLGPNWEPAPQIREQVIENTVTTVIEPKPGVFALDLRLIGTQELKGNWFTAAVSLDGVFILDRINAREITPEFPQYDFPRIDTADYKENGKWFKRCLTFETVETANIDVQNGNEEVNGIIEIKIWRCKVIKAKAKEPDNSPEIGVNNISYNNNTQNSMLVACLGPKKKFTTHQSSEASESKILDRTYKIAYTDNEGEPYAVFRFQYRSNEEAPARIEDRASNSPPDSRYRSGGESFYDYPSDHITESIGGGVDDGAVNAVSDTPNEPASGSSDSRAKVARDTTLRCKKGHLLYCPQCEEGEEGEEW